MSGRRDSLWKCCVSWRLLRAEMPYAALVLVLRVVFWTITARWRVLARVASERRKRKLAILSLALPGCVYKIVEDSVRTTWLKEERGPV